ncbi:viral DNA cleavage/packaging protein [Harp seal herpesvirus]|uniref:Viral DNA cleavage/packaging protein n=1 Tax=phocid gammaherpesvirus 3 TaxID=2560643 RepID=A0A0R5ZDS2_9GAMA|nr:viral DNA cleavage/packaging protein [Harp seal herpesvirus]AJG42956.1 viral DNA cleavage/packaging protein [Harp seal herpesvirus]
MDVHITNWRFCTNKCNLLIHVLLPLKFLESNKIHTGENLLFHVQTRYTHTLLPSKYLKVWGEVVDFVIPGADRCTSGLAISLPIHLDNNIFFNPWDVITLKIVNTKAKTKHFVNFFYITLLQAHFLAIENLKTTVPDHNISEPVQSTPLTTLFKAATAHVSEQKDSSPASEQKDSSPLGVLASLLKPKFTAVHRHHQALEDPGDVRGSGNDVQISGLPHNKDSANKYPSKRHVSIRLTVPQAKNLNIACTSTKHIVSQSEFFVCVYKTISPEDTSRYKSILDTAALDQIQNLSPVDALLNNDKFLESKQFECVHSLEQACWDANLEIFQKLPVLVERDTFTMEVIKDHFIEACFTLRQCISEQCAWVQAALTKHTKKHGVWVDFIQLWNLGPHNLGVMLPQLNAQQDLNTNRELWVQLLTDPRIVSSITKSSRVCVVVLSSLDCYLLLPGGFAIKGSYSLTEEELLVIQERYS